MELGAMGVWYAADKSEIQPCYTIRLEGFWAATHAGVWLPVQQE
jgi:hypothetical protein